jgi:hypothetical protein
MNLFRKAAAVGAAEARMAAARREVAQPAAALLARSRAHPLGMVGAAAGAGFVLGRLDVHPLRIPGLGSALSGGVAELAAQVVSLAAELGAGEGGP